MCAVSMVGDYAHKRLLEEYQSVGIFTGFQIPVSRAEFDVLKNEVLELRQLLLAAKKYDKATGQPHCEMEEKVAVLKRIGELVGVDLAEVFK